MLLSLSLDLSDDLSDLWSLISHIFDLLDLLSLRSLISQIFDLLDLWSLRYLNSLIYLISDISAQISLIYEIFIASLNCAYWSLCLTPTWKQIFNQMNCQWDLVTGCCRNSWKYAAKSDKSKFFRKKFFVFWGTPKTFLSPKNLKWP